MKKYDRPPEIEYDTELVAARRAAQEASLRHPIRMLQATHRHVKAHGAAVKRYTEKAENPERHHGIIVPEREELR